MGFQPQVAETLAGTVLIVEAIQSQNYAAGSAGWQIAADGTAEFNNVTVRGKLITGPSGSQHIEVNGSDAPQGIAFYTGVPQETFPGVIQPEADSNSLAITFASPLSAGHGGSSVRLNTGRNATDQDSLDMGSQNVSIAASNVFKVDGPSYGGGGSFVYAVMESDGTGPYWDLNAPRIFLRDTSSSNANGAVMTGGDLLRISQAWIGTATTPLVNSWADVAGARFGYTKDATGRVQLRGEVINGTAGQITTLPVGFRPTQSMEWVCRAQNGTTMCAVFVSTTGAVTVTANLATAQTGGVRLDMISFPTL